MECFQTYDQFLPISINIIMFLVYLTYHSTNRQRGERGRSQMVISAAFASTQRRLGRNTSRVRGRLPARFSRTPLDSDVTLALHLLDHPVKFSN